MGKVKKLSLFSGARTADQLCHLIAEDGKTDRGVVVPTSEGYRTFVGGRALTTRDGKAHMIDERALTVSSEMHHIGERKGVSQLVMPSARTTDSESSHR